VRARYLLSRLLEKAQQSQVSFPATVSTTGIPNFSAKSASCFSASE
jgi:pyruvate dehydrogenase complex dehydrogenase (E1) component